MSENVEIKGQPGGAAAGQGEAGMKQGHVLDLKLPIGWLLTAYGLVLGVYGLVTKKEIYEKSLGFNVNLLWGIVTLLIGGGFLAAAFVKRGKKN
jgi:type III secretory pathway component EscS